MLTRPTPHAVRRALVLALALLLGPALLAAPARAAAPSYAAPSVTAPSYVAPSYVALGDSYASGLGTGRYTHTGCRRSDLAYPRLVARQRGYGLDLRACSGATVGAVIRDQLAALGAATDFVTVSVGGNDAGFSDVLVECAKPWWAGDCDAAVDRAQRFVRTTLPGRLAGLYRDVRARAPGARVVVVGYPRLFMGEDCNAGTWFAPAEQRRLNTTADQLNARLRAAASGAGFAFADPTRRFRGHAVCDRDEWVNGLSNPVRESYHPNRDGHAAGYAPLVGALLR